MLDNLFTKEKNIYLRHKESPKEKVSYHHDAPKTY